MSPLLAELLPIAGVSKPIRSAANEDELDPRIAAPEVRARVASMRHELLANAEPAVWGADGSENAMELFRRLKDYGSTDEEIIEDVLAEGGYNDRAVPPWEPAELAALVRRSHCTIPTGARLAEMEFGPVEVPEMPTPVAAPPRPKLFWEVMRDIRLNRSSPALIKSLLELGALSVLFGDSNTGKSFFAIALGMHVALGWAWRGRKVTQGAVVYIAAEGGQGFKKRLLAARQHYDLGDRNVPFYLVPCPINLLDPDADTGALIELIRTVEEDAGQKVVLVIVDTLARALTGGDENSSEAMGAFIANLDRIRTATGAHVGVVHHSGKDRSKGARGHSSLRAACDTEIQIADGVATVTKARESERAEAMPFKLHVVSIGEDEDGDPITSCVAVADSAAEFHESHEDHATIVQRIQTHLQRGAQTSARQLERDHGGLNGIFKVNASRLRTAIQQAVSEGQLREVSRGRAKFLALPEGFGS